MSAMTFFGNKKFGGGKKQGASPLRRNNGLRHKNNNAQRVRAPAPAVDASVKRKTKTERKALPWRQWGARALPVFAVTLVIGLFAGGWTLLDYVGSVPVSRVAVTGTLLHVDRNLLVERVRPHLHDKGFMTVDLDAIRADLLQLPWIADVSIQRRWPDQLVIEVTEQEAIARWGKDGLLNRYGEVFRPKSLGDTDNKPLGDTGNKSLGDTGNQALGDVSQLPLLYGPDNLSGEVVERYAELRDLLSEQKLTLSDFGSDERGSWSATLQSGVVLRLGTGDILKKMRSFSRVYRAELSTQMDRIAYIDLRYGNGLAVGWKNSEGKDQHINSGVSGHG